MSVTAHNASKAIEGTRINASIIRVTPHSIQAAGRVRDPSSWMHRLNLDHGNRRRILERGAHLAARIHTCHVGLAGADVGQGQALLAHVVASPGFGHVLPFPGCARHGFLIARLTSVRTVRAASSALRRIRDAASVAADSATKDVSATDMPIHHEDRPTNSRAAANLCHPPDPDDYSIVRNEYSQSPGDSSERN